MVDIYSGEITSERIREALKKAGVEGETDAATSIHTSCLAGKNKTESVLHATDPLYPSR